jgi:hypothetical protein
VTPLDSWSAWASPLAWTIGTLAASWMTGHLLGVVFLSRAPRWLSSRQQRLSESALQILRLGGRS